MTDAHPVEIMYSTTLTNFPPKRKTKCMVVPSLALNTRYIVPLGDWKNIGMEFLQSVQEYAVAYFTGMDVTVMDPVPLEGKRLTARIDRWSHQEQYKTTDLMNLLKKMMPQDAYCISGITFYGNFYQHPPHSKISTLVSHPTTSCLEKPHLLVEQACSSLPRTD